MTPTISRYPIRHISLTSSTTRIHELPGSCWHAVGVSSAKFAHLRYWILRAWVVLGRSVYRQFVVKGGFMYASRVYPIKLENMPCNIQIVVQGLASLFKNVFQLQQHMHMYFVFASWLCTVGGRGAEFDARGLDSRKSEQRTLRVSIRSSSCGDCAVPHRDPLHSSPQCFLSSVHRMHSLHLIAK